MPHIPFAEEAELGEAGLLVHKAHSVSSDPQQKVSELSSIDHHCALTATVWNAALGVRSEYLVGTRELSRAYCGIPCRFVGVS